MNPFAIALFVILGALLWSVPKKLALTPFLAGCCLLPSGQGLDLGFINQPIFRWLLLIGILRVIAKGERLPTPLNAVDKLMLCWAAWYFFSSMFHDWQLDAGPVYVAGVIYNLLGFYFLVRIWCCNLDDTTDIIKIIALLLVPISLEMLFEKGTGKNLFSYFGGVPENVLMREGRLRAQGPFLHPILAGTVGATCIPLFVGILRESRVIAMIGLGAGCFMVFASSSSGPIMSLMGAVFALMIWNVKEHTKAMRIGAVILYVLLMLLMERPPYYLISKIDLSGGSTGWHRSFLIDQTIRYFPEWWLFGTDYTKHWMPLQGTAASPTHTDITNYYISFAVGGGLPGLLLILCIFRKSFAWVGKIQMEIFEKRPDNSFMIWCFGSALFAHAVTSISVAYFDQSVVFLWLNVAVISSMYSAMFTNEGDVREMPDDAALEGA